MQVEALQDLVHKTREARRKQTLPKYPPHERDTLIRKYHPDFRESAYRPIKFGPNAGDLTVRELAALLEGDSPVPGDLDLTPAHSVDVLVIGGGGAGSSAALHAHARGAQVMLATKLRLGDSNTVMAQGGMQVAIADEDSPVQHFLDTLKGGHMKKDHQLLKVMVEGNGIWSGAGFQDLDNKRFFTVAAKVVILATGGIGRLHIQGFPTSNHYGATGDGLSLAYRLGAKLLQIDTFQYHPTGAVYPEQLVGALVTEGIRSEGGHLVNAKGERFVNELDTRDVVSSSIIRECEEGRGVRTVTGRLGVWLDTPLLDVESGLGTLEKHFPAMVRQFKRYGIDITKDPVLIYPTLHYQNGGVQIDVNGESGVRNLFVAGEASGGLHGRNRLMGNSLLDLMVFGKRAGTTAAERAKAMKHGKLTLEHLARFRAEARKHTGALAV